LSSPEQDGAERRAAFLDAIETLLRPLMPVVLSYGITGPDISEVFKSLYLETLAKRLKEQGRPATVARLALMTGLPRAEVDKLRARKAERRELRSLTTQRFHLFASLLAMWHDDSQFSTPYGAPLDLSLQPERGFRTFSEIVESAAPGSNVSLVLDELLAAGCVEVHAEKFVRCINRVFIPSGVDVSRIVRLGQSVGAMVSTLVHNVFRDPSEPAYFERALMTGGTVKREFRIVALKHLNTALQEVIEQIDRWWESKEEEYHESPGARYGLQAFFYEEPPSDTDIETAPQAAAG